MLKRLLLALTFVSAFSFVGEALLMLWLLARGRRIRLPDDSPA